MIILPNKYNDRGLLNSQEITNKKISSKGLNHLQKNQVTSNQQTKLKTKNTTRTQSNALLDNEFQLQKKGTEPLNLQEVVRITGYDQNWGNKGSQKMKVEFKVN